MSEQTPVTDVVTILRRYFQATDTTGRSHDWWMLRAEEVTKALHAQPDLAALRAARDEVYGLLSIDSRYDRRDGAAVMKADVLAVFDRLLSDATEPVAGGSGDAKPAVCDTWEWDGPYRFRCGRQLDADGKCQRHWARRPATSPARGPE